MLVTGASGFIGQRLIQRLIQDGVTARAAIHRSNPLLPTLCEPVQVGPVGSETDWRESLAGVDVVVHLAGRAHVLQEHAEDPLAAFREVNAAGTARLAEQAAAEGVRRIVFVSSIGVHGVSTDGRGPFSRDEVPEPVEAYAQSKLEGEAALLRIADETGIEPVVIRPPLVYGPNAGGNFGRLLRWVERGIPLPLGSVHNRRSLVAVDNLVDLLCECAHNPAAAGQVFLVSDGEDLSTADLIREIGKALGKAPYLFPVPPALLRLGGRLIGRNKDVSRLIGSLQVDSAPVRKTLQWTPPVSVREGIRRAVQAAPSPNQM